MGSLNGLFALIRVGRAKLANEKPILIVNSGGEAAVPDWTRHLNDAAPHLAVHWWHDTTVPAERVAYALVWAPEHGRLAAYPNLRMIISSAVGVDHLTADPSLPRHLPIVRMGGSETAQRMGEFVCLGALSLLRDLKRITDQQHAGVWQNFQQHHCATDLRAGVLGLGNLGTKSATMLRDLGFPTAGWSKSRKAIDGVDCFAGAAELDGFLARSDILVCLLPDTPETRGILCAETLARLPRGAGLVNVGRGGHLVLDDLRAALDSGQVSGAFLDVFDPEPLPAGHWLWAHPKVIVSPHVAALASVRGRSRMVADAIAAFERGEAPPGLYDPGRGY